LIIPHRRDTGGRDRAGLRAHCGSAAAATSAC